MLKELREKLKSRQADLDLAAKDIRILKRKILEEETGHKEGDIYQNKKGERGILVHCNSWHSNWSWRKLKKDGEPSASVTYCNGVPIINR